MKESGIGRENGLEAFHACTLFFYLFGLSSAPHKPIFADTQSKSTIVNIASVDETRQNDDWFADSSDGSPRRYG